MRKELLLLLLPFFFATGIIEAQRAITGTVTDQAGDRMFGANIFAPLSQLGTTTDVDGNFLLEVPDDETLLVISFTGFETQEVDISNANVVAIQMIEGELLGELVVTAAGIERQRKDLGYSISTIKSEEFTVARETNIVNALAGKTSGVHITNQSGNLGGSSKILIRGINSLSGNNNPLWVVDGVPVFDSNISTGDRISGGFDIGNRAQDINPDDIESISILKGAAAAALYGSRAANGAIIVTTKRGKAGNNANITFNSSMRFDNPLRLPDFQDSYAQGGRGKFEVENSQNGWGPFIQGQEVVDFRGETTNLEAFPNNVADFYETGATIINNLALSGGNEYNDYRLSLTALNQTGIFPGSELDRYTASFNSGMKFAQNISSRFGLNFVRTTSAGRVAQGANDPNVLTSIINGLPRNIDVATLQPWISESTTGATQLNALSPTSNNPYWVAFENKFDTEVDRLYGNFELKYEPVFWLDFIARLGYDNVVDDRFRSNRKGTRNRVNGDFTEDKIQQRQLDFNFMASANRGLTEDLFLKVIVGYNYNTRIFERLTVGASDLTFDELFSYGNADVSNPINDFSQRRLFGLYGDITLSYKEWLSLNLTGRNDWSSTLPKINNSYFYPSVSLAFIFTDALGISNDFLTYGKLRASFAQVGNDTAPYQLNFNFIPQSTAFGQFGTSTTYPFNGTLAFAGTNTIPPGDNLRPESVNSFEFGTELQFYNGRIGLDATYYNVETKDQILAVAIPQSTGFAFRRENVGITTNEGIELELNINPISNKNFDWNMLTTFTKNVFNVKELKEGVDRLVVNSGFNSIQIIAEPGKPYGLYGNKFSRASSDSTKIIVDPETGLRSGEDNGRLGDVYPDFIFGLSNRFRYKNFSFSFTLDWRNGGIIYSETIQTLRALGLAEETAVNRQGAFIDREAYIEQADGSLRQNDIPITTQDFWGTYASGQIAEGNVFDASFLKVREIGISYSFPESVLAKTPFQRISIGLEARNPFLLYSAIPHIDPETNLFGSANDGAGIEFNSPPTARSIGVNLQIAF